jgi:hypothetical protein
MKPLGQMNRSLVSSIYGRSSKKIAHLQSPLYNGHLLITVTFVLSRCILLYILIRYSGHLFNVVSGHQVTSGIIFKLNLPLYKGFTLRITYKWWPLTTLNRWPLYLIKIYSKMHRESTKVTVMSRWNMAATGNSCFWLADF